MTGEVVLNGHRATTPAPEAGERPKSMSRVPLKDVVREHLVDGDLEAIVDLTLARRKTLGTLLAMTFDADPQVAWRAIEAQGMAAETLSAESPAFVKEHVRKLLWLITEESGAVFWRAPECMAECAARMPELMKEHVSIAFHLIETLEPEDLEHFRPGALWAVGRLVHEAGRYLSDVLPLIQDALDHPDPQTRGMAAWCLGEVGEGGILDGKPELLEDDGPVQLYRDRILEHTTVGAVTRKVLDG